MVAHRNSWVGLYLHLELSLKRKKAEWKPFRNALNKKERKEFNDMFDIPRSYLPACSNAVSPVPLQPIITSILFHHYKELTELNAQVEQMKGEKQFKDVAEDYIVNAGTVDRYFVVNNKMKQLT
jgi:hypothetical protein